MAGTYDLDGSDAAQLGHMSTALTEEVGRWDGPDSAISLDDGGHLHLARSEPGTAVEPATRTGNKGSAAGR